jgi:hypothetical protein
MLSNQVDITSLSEILCANDPTRSPTQDILVHVTQPKIWFVTQHSDHMSNVRSADTLAGLEELVEFFENPPRERSSILITLDSEFIPTRVNLDPQRSFDQSKRRFTVAVECDGRRVVIEGQAHRGCCFFSSQ